MAPGLERLDHPPGQSGHSFLALNVPYQGRLSSQDDPAHDRVVARRPRKDALDLAQTGGTEPVACDHMDHVAVVAVHSAEARAAETHRPFDDDVEDGLDIGRGTGDHAASFVSLNRRAFSMAIMAWSAKVWINAMCVSENGATTSRATRMVPRATPSWIIGTARTLR